MSKEANMRLLDKGVIKVGVILSVCFMMLAGLFYWVVSEEWRVQRVKADTVSPQMAFSDAGGELLIEQMIFPNMDVIEEIRLWSIKKGYSGIGEVELQVLESNNIIYQTKLPVEKLPESGAFPVTFDKGELSDVRGKVLTLRLISPRTEKGLAVTFIYGTSVDIGKFGVPSNIDMNLLSVNGSKLEGQLYCALSGYNLWLVMRLFWPVAGLLFLGLLAYILVVAYKKAHHKFSVTVYALECYHKYRFLIRQLVSRDFNTKYRRSVLGVIWSFLNPLLTMVVQYIVFSILFQSAIENFQLYLLSGIVLFNFFNEAVSMGMESITTNASLINKVYMPKYIYPIARVLSSVINLMFSFVPLLAVMLFSKISITKAILLLPIPLGLLILFCVGLSFLLSTANVFFRDTKFLWGVFALLWTYLTPIFYPESIIPSNILPFYRMNPIYQFLSFFRSIVMHGVTPEPMTYLWCILCALIPLVLGAWVFRKKQDDFILYL